MRSDAYGAPKFPTRGRIFVLTDIGGTAVFTKVWLPLRDGVRPAYPE